MKNESDKNINGGKKGHAALPEDSRHLEQGKPRDGGAGQLAERDEKRRQKRRG